MDFAALSTPVGTLELAVDGDTLVSLEFVDASDAPTADAGSSRVVAGLEAYFDGDLDVLASIPVRLEGGTPFQRDVWQALRDIPLGDTISYADLARRVGRPKAFRAVGSANGQNPIAIVVPCHRVIAADGTLGGYGGGLDRKRWLLAHEGVTGIPDAERQGMLC
jgi:methylated-DNA-[protein]-cysteine S-methyltransferase